MTDLAKYDAACRMLAEAVAVDEVLEVRITAEALRHYAHQAKNRELEINATHIRFRAERRLGAMIVVQKEAVGLNRGGGEPGVGRRGKQCSVDGVQHSPPPTLKEAGIDRKLSSRAQRMAAIEPQQFETFLELHRAKAIKQSNKVSVDLLRASAKADGREKRRQLAKALSDITDRLPTGRKFPCVYADPPWRCKRGVTGQSYGNQDSSLSWDQICALPVADLLLPDAWVFIWIPRVFLLAPHPVDLKFPKVDGPIVARTVKLPLTWALALAWGCDPHSIRFVWSETDKTGRNESADHQKSLLLFERGHGLPKPDSNKDFRFNCEPVYDQSEGLDHDRNNIRRMTGGLPVLDLFAHVDDKHVLPADWHAWRDQPDRTVAEIKQEPDGTILTSTTISPASLINAATPEGSLDIPAALKRSVDNVAPFFHLVQR